MNHDVSNRAVDSIPSNMAADQSVVGPTADNPAGLSSPTRSLVACFPGLSPEERFVLFAIQRAREGLKESHLSFLTCLGIEPTKQALAVLEGLKLVEHFSDGALPRYFAVALSSVPLFHEWESWWASFCTFDPPVCVGDGIGTSFATVENMLLLALLSGSRDAQVLTRLTLLPRLFVDYVIIEMISPVEVWCSVDLHRLERKLIESRNNRSDILECLHSIMERLWDLWWTPERDVRLNRLRAGHQIGGFLDNWADDGECLDTLEWAYRDPRH